MHSQRAIPRYPIAYQQETPLPREKQYYSPAPVLSGLKMTCDAGRDDGRRTRHNAGWSGITSALLVSCRTRHEDAAVYDDNGRVLYRSFLQCWRCVGIVYTIEHQKMGLLRNVP